MNEVDPPPPLDAGADTPEELRAVLRALGREGPGRGTLERVARELGPYMDAAPGLGVPIVEAARTGGKLLVARALAALLALGGTAYLVQRAWPTASEPRPLQARVEAPRAQAVQPVAAEVAIDAPAVNPEADTEARPDVPAQVVSEARRDRRGRHAARKREALAPRTLVANPETASEETASEEAASAEVPSAEVPSATAATADAASVADTRAANAQPAVSAPPAAARVAEAAAEEPVARQVTEPSPDEFTLLWQARERLRRDPAGALALLDAHEGRFASGQLAPEREVLAVEVLRVLGRTGEADARLRKFRARYPGSIHLRRLQQGR